MALIVFKKKVCLETHIIGRMSFFQNLVILTFTPNEDDATNIKFLVKYRIHIQVLYLATLLYVMSDKNRGTVISVTSK